MAPNIRSSQLETRTQRGKLIARRKPYSIRVAPGIRLGYRRNEGAGTWSVICANGAGGAWMQRLALADDAEDADGKLIMDFWQAAEAAKKLARATDGAAGDRPVTVKEAVQTYQRDLAARGGAEVNATSLLPKLSAALASKPVGLLVKKDIIGFRDSLIAAGNKPSTVNRTMNQLIAALNLAASLDERIVNSRAWKIKILPDATEARNVILSDNEVRAIVGAAYELDPAFGLLVEVLAATGARISQALRLTVADLLLPGDRLNMPVSRKGKAKKAVEKRPLPIPSGLAAKLKKHAAGRRKADPLLVDGNGAPWTERCQIYRFPDVVTAVGLDPEEVTSYALRHSSIVRQLLANVPTRVVAANHDTSVAKIEQHYSRYITDHSEQLTRAALLDPDPPPAPPPAANDNYRGGWVTYVSS